MVCIPSFGKHWPKSRLLRAIGSIYHSKEQLMLSPGIEYLSKISWAPIIAKFSCKEPEGENPYQRFLGWSGHRCSTQGSNVLTEGTVLQLAVEMAQRGGAEISGLESKVKSKALRRKLPHCWGIKSSMIEKRERYVWSKVVWPWQCRMYYYFK